MSQTLQTTPNFPPFDTMALPSTSNAKVVVGLDFGKTFSGFAYALTSKPDEVHTFYEWPVAKAAGSPGHYGKTQTALLYQRGDSAGSFVLQDWGNSALVEYANGMNSTWSETANHAEDVLIANELSQAAPINSKTASNFLTLLNLHLFGTKSRQTLAAELPEGLTARRLVSDYLQEMSQFILTTLRNRLGSDISMQDVQWYLTVPANLDDEAKQDMKICATMAGMVQGLECPPGYKDSTSPHPLMIVTKPEAASLYCQRKLQFPMASGDKFMIVDIGGETTNLVLHEKVDSVVREVSPSCSEPFGGSFVDRAFFKFLSDKISCFQDFALTHPGLIMNLKGLWETIKCEFDGTMHTPYHLELPAGLALAWQEDECSKKPTGRRHSKNMFSSLQSSLSWFSKQDETNVFSYDAVELSLNDMRSLFDPVVNGILKFIKSKMVKGLKLEAMMIVGGFSSSPYLCKRIRKEFSAKVGKILAPEDPGSAISCGAVFYGLYGPEVLLSRKSKKTYGILVSELSCETDPPKSLFKEKGESYSEKFLVLRKKNDEIPLDHAVTLKVYPLIKGQTFVGICLLSSSDLNPIYSRDTGIKIDDMLFMRCPSEKKLGKRPEILVSVSFRRNVIEVEAKGLNFGTGKTHKMACRLGAC